MEEQEQATTTNKQKQEALTSKPFGAGEDATFIPFIDGDMNVHGTLDEPQWLRANRLSLSFVSR